MLKEESPFRRTEAADAGSLWHAAASPPWWRTFLFRILSGRQLSVFLYLLTCMDGENACHPTIEEIRSFVGLNSPAMVFEALSALDRLGFVARFPRMVATVGGRRNLYRRPPFQYTIMKLLENGLLDEHLRVTHNESSYTPVVMEELDDALREMLDGRYEEYLAVPAAQRREILLEQLAKSVRESGFQPA